jgi:TRAP-type C4-dicarboxylate transport system substrate-binding protein
MRRILIGLALATALLTTLALPAGAQQVTIRWGDVVAGAHPSVQMIDRIAAEVKEKSGGRIVIQSFPGGQLGGSRDMIDAVANGAQQWSRKAPPTSARGSLRSRSSRRRTSGATRRISTRR